MGAWRNSRDPTGWLSTDPYRQSRSVSWVIPPGLTLTDNLMMIAHKQNLEIFLLHHYYIRYSLTLLSRVYLMYIKLLWFRLKSGVITKLSVSRYIYTPFLESLSTSLGMLLLQKKTLNLESIPGLQAGQPLPHRELNQGFATFRLLIKILPTELWLYSAAKNLTSSLLCQNDLKFEKWITSTKSKCDEVLGKC